VVDFTREIKQATETASATPQLAAPSNSLGADIVNAVGTGMQFYQQQQAKTQLQELTQKQSAQERMIAEGIMGYREQRQSIANQEGITRTQLAEYDKKFLSRYPPEMQYEIVSGTNKLTGTNLGAMSSSISAKEKEKRNAEMDIKVKRATMEDAVASSSSSSGYSVHGIQDMSEEELRNLHIQGQIDAGERQRSSAVLTKSIAQGTYNEMEAKKKTKAFLSAALPQFRNQFSSSILTTIDGLGGFNNITGLGGKEAMLDVIQLQKRSIPQLILEQQQNAKDKGITYSLEQQNAFKTAATEEITRAEELLSDESYVKLFDAQNDRILRDGLFKMSTSSDPQERAAAISTLMMMSSNIPLGDVEKSAIAKITSRAISGQIRFNIEDDESTPAQKVTVLTEKIKQESLGGGYSETDKKHNAAIVLNSITGTKQEVNAFANAGGINKLARSIASTEGKSLSLEAYAEIEEALFSESYKRVSAAQARAINTQTSRTYSAGTGRSSDRIMVSTDVLKNFSLSPDTGLLENISGSYVVPDSVKRYNSYMKDLFKSFEILGVDEGRVKDFIDNAIKSMMVLEGKQPVITPVKTKKESVAAPPPTPKLTQIDYSDYDDGMYEDEEGNQIKIRKGKVV